MLKENDELKKQLNAVAEENKKAFEKYSNALVEVSQKTEKIANNIGNVNIIISDIDKQFKEKTGISNPKDMIFLFIAIGLQCARWILIPTLDEESLSPTKEGRKDSASEGKKDKTGSKSQIDKERDNEKEYPNCKQIILYPVPFDAMKGTEDIVIPGVTPLGKNISGTNHHSATLGHDPVVGQIFGTANILTRSITFHDGLLTTRRVELVSGRQQLVVKEPTYNVPLMMQDVFSSIQEERKRIVSALIKENLHLQSDKFTKSGLPIPFLSPALQQKLLELNWNSKELENLLKGGLKGIANNIMVASIINEIVGVLHGFCYNENEDDSLSLYSVRTRKVVMISNIIAECINVFSVAAGVAIGAFTENSDLIKKSISHFDIGGILVMIRQIAQDGGVQEKIRREYLEHELFDRITDGKYSFLEESHYE